MKHAVTQPASPTPIAGGQLTVHQVPVWEDNLVWLIEGPGKEGAVVDGPDASVMDAADRLGLKVTTLLNTHTHFDHIGINHALGPALQTLKVIGPKSRADEIPGLTHPVEDGDRFEVLGVKVEAILTEGHIDGHISYRFYAEEENAIFVGDTMFGAGCGYLFDGPPQKMHDSLQRLVGFPDDTWIFPAHEYTQDNLRFAWSVEPGNAELKDRIQAAWAIRREGGSTLPTTIGLEKKTNPFVRVDQPEIIQALKTALPDTPLQSAGERFAAIRRLKDEKTYRSLPESSLPL